MSELILRYLPPGGAAPERAHPGIGRCLVERGAISGRDLHRALEQQRAQRTQLGKILLASGQITERQLYQALADQSQAKLVDLARNPPDPDLMRKLGHQFCLKHGVVPWRQRRNVTLIATSRPGRIEQVARDLPQGMLPVLPVIAPQNEIDDQIRAHFPYTLRRRAETRVAEDESCRAFLAARASRRKAALAFLLVFGALLAAFPLTVFTALTVWAVLTMLAAAGLKASAAVSVLRHGRGGFGEEGPDPGTAGSVISILVPLHRETSILQTLVARLERLDYPPALLDVIFITEEKDSAMNQALAAMSLPSWVRVMTVPEGALTTKPRALNYALDFCRGEIVGIYDAEDAPAPDQLRKVDARFRTAPPDVACLQGILDYYNPRDNWLARCFTIEYATWFRVILPGMTRLGLAIPLGGTTLFFRRAVLERLGGWDAHNVTEDADLGMRLARHGYRTELLSTVTGEEANCHLWPWVKQRSRWLKGYMITYAVHARRPKQLWRDLGTRKFLGFHVFFLSALSQFLLAPLLLSFWLVLAGLNHPMTQVLGQTQLILLGSLFLALEVLNIAIGMYAVSGRQHRHLMAWVPSLHFYYPLGALAAYKGLYEMVISPFFWDKTEHGHSSAGTDAPAARIPEGVPAE